MQLISSEWPHNHDLASLKSQNVYYVGVCTISYLSFEGQNSSLRRPLKPNVSTMVSQGCSKPISAVLTAYQ